MRNLHELYLLLWEQIKDAEHISGICSEIHLLRRYGVISLGEHKELFSHFGSQKPTEELHEEFFNNERYDGYLWWWSVEEDINPVNRKAFIQKMIEITKEQ